MNSKKKGLGKGLSALFGDQKSPENKEFQGSIRKISIASIKRNKYQPRLVFDDEKLNELSASIKKWNNSAYSSPKKTKKIQIFMK